MAGQIKVDSINADSNLALKIANTAVAFIDATGLRPTSGNVNLDATATSKLYLPSANTVAIQTAGVTGLSISSSQVVTLANALPVTSGGTGVTTSTGTGAVVLGTSPTITTPTISSLSSASATALTLQSAGTTAITVDTSQQVGVGATSSTWSAGKALELGNTGCGVWGTATLASLVAGYSYNSGDKYAQTGAYAMQYQISQTNGTFTWYTTNATGTAGNAATMLERMKLVSGGTLMIGTTSETPAGSGDTKGIAFNNSATSSQIYATGNGDTCAVFNRAGSDGATVRLRRQGSDVGSISTTASATAYNTSSDYRLKDNVQPMSGALAKVALLKPVTYKWKVDGSDSEGFIAHELQAIKPDCVSGAKDAVDADGNPQYQGIDTSFLVATLTAAIQELKAINDTQAETITALTARIVALETI